MLFQYDYASNILCVRRMARLRRRGIAGRGIDGIDGSDNTYADDGTLTQR
jgi:hypothetical protein